MPTLPRMLSPVLALLALIAVPLSAFAASPGELNRSAQAALKTLYGKSPAAKSLGPKAVGILVFPKVTKGGFGVAGQYGEGVLLRGGKPAAYYNTAGASIGLQIGAQQYGYALFFLSEKTLRYLNQSEGFEVGLGPSLVMGDEGLAKSTTTTTAQESIYAFTFDQKGAMASIGLQGNKITKLEK